MGNICFINSDVNMLDGRFTQVPELLSASRHIQFSLCMVGIVAVRDLPSEPFAQRCLTFLYAAVARM